MKHLHKWDSFGPLFEKIIRIPDTQLDRIEELWKTIGKFRNIWKEKNPTSKEPYYPIQLRNFFVLDDMRGNPTKVHVGVFSEDPKKKGSAMIDTNNPMPTILINLQYNTDFEEFHEIIEHELIHIIDPKVNDEDLSDKLYTKYGADPSKGPKQISKYFKSPWEFDAYSTNIIKAFKKAVGKNPENRKMSYDFVSDVKNMESHKSYRKWHGWMSDNGIRGFRFLQRWKEKPTMWKQFLKRMHAELG
jgi:hypothetical protein